MKKFLLIFLILFVLISAAILVIGRKKRVTYTIPLDFTQVGQGSMLLRDKNDRVYSAVITSYQGFEKFKDLYPIELNLTGKDFKYSFYIVAFSDSSWGVEADGFKQKYASSYYYLDVADTGMDIKAKPPPEGKKYTAYAVIKVSDKVVDRNKIGHVQVREGVLNGLTKWF